eukprot:3854532-Pleurochrysis_carterae.AAC.2
MPLVEFVDACALRKLPLREPLRLLCRAGSALTREYRNRYRVRLRSALPLHTRKLCYTMLACNGLKKHAEWQMIGKES